MASSCHRVSAVSEAAVAVGREDWRRKRRWVGGEEEAVEVAEEEVAEKEEEEVMEVAEEEVMEGQRRK